MKILRAAALSLWMGCAEAPEAPTSVDSGPVEIALAIQEGAALSEALAECDDAAVVAPHQLLCLQGGVAWWVDEAAEEPLALTAATSLSAAATDDAPWLLLDGALFALRGEALLPIDLDLPVPLSALRREGGRTWMWGAGRLFELREGDVHEIIVEGISEIHDWTASEEALFLATPELLALRWEEAAWTPRWAWAEPATDLAVDPEGRLWALIDGAPHVWSGDPTPLVVSLPEPVRAVAGPALWLAGEEALYHLEGRRLTRHERDPEGLLGVDDLGRALQLSEGALWRHAVGRPVAVVGLPDELSVQQEVTLLPSDPDTLTSMSVWVDDQALPLERAPWRVTLDPDALPAGERALRVLTESALGDHLDVHPLWVGALPEVEWAQVQAISEAHCASCHGGDTATRLVSADDWRLHIDRAIALVSAGEMPLGSAPLDDDDIVTLRAWRQGGFQ